MKSCFAASLLLPLAVIVASAQFTEWSPPVNLGPVVNSVASDYCLTLSKNGLSLFFRSWRDGASKLYVSQRASVNDPWGTPKEVEKFNDGYYVSCPGLSPDEHRMFFVGTRSEGCGLGDIWVSRRHDRRDDFGWESPVNLGCAPDGPNTASGEVIPTVFEDETGTEVLYFTSGRPGGLGGGDIWQSRMRPDGTFGPATLVAELSSPSYEAVAVRRDGLEAILSSNRPGGVYPPSNELWTSKRESTADPWPPPVILPVLSSNVDEGGRMAFSFDGRTFCFGSNRYGGYGSSDLWCATREKQKGR